MLYVSTVALQVLDAHSTLRAVAHGFREINMVVAPLLDSPASWLAVKTLAAAGTILLGGKGLGPQPGGDGGGACHHQCGPGGGGDTQLQSGDRAEAIVAFSPVAAQQSLADHESARTQESPAREFAHPMNVEALRRVFLINDGPGRGASLLTCMDRHASDPLV